MAYEHNEGRGTLFKNDDAAKEGQPFFKGDCKVGGREYWISGWVERPDGKKPRVSLSIREKVTRAAPAPQRTTDDPRTSLARELDDEIPF
jgi:hypothetical protein